MEVFANGLDPARLSGTVVVLPLVNVPSFQQKVAHVNPVDGKNMNRAYPGRPDGTQTERASYAITTQVVERADYLIDMHGGDVDEDLRPFSYWTPTGNAALDSASQSMVLAFGLDHIVVSRDRPTDPADARFLENAAITRGKPAFTAEAGAQGAVMRADVDTLVKGTLSVMARLKMLERAYTTVTDPVWLTEMLTVTGDSTGMFSPAVQPRQRVTKGATLGVTMDYWGRPVETVRAPADGIVLYVRPVPSIMKGETVAAIGVPGTP
jgi:predicted deacylase